MPVAMGLLNRSGLKVEATKLSVSIIQLSNLCYNHTLRGSRCCRKSRDNSKELRAGALIDATTGLASRETANFHNTLPHLFTILEVNLLISYKY